MTMSIADVSAVLTAITAATSEQTGATSAAVDDAVALIRELHTENASMRARLAHVRAVRDHVAAVTPSPDAADEWNGGRWAAYTDARTRLTEALDGVAW